MSWKKRAVGLVLALLTFLIWYVLGTYLDRLKILLPVSFGLLIAGIVYSRRLAKNKELLRYLGIRGLILSSLLPGLGQAALTGKKRRVFSWTFITLLPVILLLLPSYLFLLNLFLVDVSHPVQEVNFIFWAVRLSMSYAGLVGIKLIPILYMANLYDAYRTGENLENSRVAGVQRDPVVQRIDP